MQTEAPLDTVLVGGDLVVNRIGFGAMRLTDWRSTPDRDQAVALLRRAVELGVNLIDTADSYGLGLNEELIAAALHPYAESLVIATKAGQSRPSESEWVPLGRPEYLRQQVELSLRRLRVDTIELFQLHRVDPQVPLAEQVGALADLRAQGQIRHIGLSEVTIDQIEEAQATAPIVSVQNAYNIARRRHDRVVDYCTDHHLAFLPWMPINYGKLADARSTVTSIAAEVGCEPAKVALAWLLARSPVMIPIPGTTSMDHLVQNWEAGSIALTDEQMTRLSQDFGADTVG